MIDTAFERLSAEAADPDTAPERLVELAKVAPLRQIIAANPNAPTNLFFALGREYPHEFLDNPLLPLIYLAEPQELMGIDKLTALAVLRLGDAPSWLLGAWRQHSDEMVREAVRYHIGQLDDPERESGHAKAEAALQRTPIMVSRQQRQWPSRGGEIEHVHFPPLELPDWIVLTFRKHSSDEIRDAILRADISARLLAQFARQRDLRQAVAAHPNTSPDVLGQLARDDDYQVRAAVARSRNVSRETLKTLARDAAHEVRAQVACNPLTPVDILNRLAGDTNSAVRLSVAGNHNAPLNRLAHDKNNNVRQAALRTKGMAHQPSRARTVSATKQCRQIAGHLEETQDIAHYLFSRIILLSYPDLPDDVLAAHAASWRWPERYVIARHPNAGRATLEELAGDGNRFVRAAAREKLGERMMESETIS